MRRLVIAFAMTFALVQTLFAQGGPETAIRGTIQSQIEAFQEDDFVTAFGFASPSIQMMFRTPENFGTMVRRGFPMVWRPASVSYGALNQHAGALWQQVTITDQSGTRFDLAYRMEPSETGWKIAGVVFLQGPDLSA